MRKKAKISNKERKNLSFIDTYFFYPNTLQKILAFLLLPISCIYFLINILLKNMGKKKDFELKIISIGNLVSGGSGKTPFCISLANFLESKNYNNVFIILRGYKRASKGLIIVKDSNKILCGVKDSGDEAMLIAQSVSCNVIVCENRENAINYAKEHGACVILLDDGYRFNFVKFDILLEPLILPYFNFVLPSGYYRFPPKFYKMCDLHLKEGIDYKRNVGISFMQKDLNNIRFILVSAIANPARLESFLPKNIVYKYFLGDHETFSEKILLNLLQQHNADCILMTKKDYVKCENFSLPIAILELDVKIDSNALAKIINFLES